jgi:phosphoglycolate phosphatase-like HAD superfamily hydrolase
MKFNLEKFSDYPIVKKSILDANALSAVLLLDLDETLVSHKSFVFDRILKYLDTLSCHELNPELSEKLFKQIEFVGTDGILDFVIDHLFKSAKIDDLLIYLRSDLGLPEGFFRPGVKETLTRLNESFSLKICTNGNELQQVIKTQYLNEMLRFEISPFFCSSIAPKPSPLCLIRALGDTSPDHALFIGDSEVDLMAAESAGVKFLNVSSLLHST